MAVLGDLLFYSGSRRPGLSEVLRHNLTKTVPAEVEKVPDREFSGTPDADLTQQLIERCRINLIELNLEEAEGGAEPTRVSVRDYFSGTVEVEGLKITKTIPFDGDPALFQLQPNTYDMNPPRGVVRGQKVTLGMEVRESEAEQAIRYIEETVGAVERYIGWQVPLIDQHNAELPGAVAAAIQARRDRDSKASDIASRLSGR